MKKLLVITAALILAAGLAFAGGGEIKGKVTAVTGKTITIEVEKGDPTCVTVGDSVEVEVKSEKKAPKKGKDMLMGC